MNLVFAATVVESRIFGREGEQTVAGKPIVFLEAIWAHGGASPFNKAFPVYENKSTTGGIKMRKKLTTGLVIGLFMLGLCGIAQANTITGSLWHVPEATAQNATPGNVPGTLADVIFDVNSPMNFSGSNVTVGTWLASSGAFNIVENTAGTLASLMDNLTEGTLVEFTGMVSVTNGQTFTVTHDDGLTLTIGVMTVINEPGPTAPTTTTRTYTGDTGNFEFQLVYGECCGGPAVLQIDLPLSNVPEPSTLLLLGIGIAGLAGTTLRRKK